VGAADGSDVGAGVAVAVGSGVARGACGSLHPAMTQLTCHGKMMVIARHETRCPRIYIYNGIFDLFICSSSIYIYTIYYIYIPVQEQASGTSSALLLSPA
jgi:hypothetical protein